MKTRDKQKKKCRIRSTTADNGKAANKNGILQLKFDNVFPLFFLARPSSQTFIYLRTNMTQEEV